MITTDAEQRAVKLDSISLQLAGVEKQLLTDFYNTIATADDVQDVLDILGTDGEDILNEYAATLTDANSRGVFPPVFDPVEYEIQLDGSVTWVEPPAGP